MCIYDAGRMIEGLWRVELHAGRTLANHMHKIATIVEVIFRDPPKFHEIEIFRKFYEFEIFRLPLRIDVIRDRQPVVLLMSAQAIQSLILSQSHCPNISCRCHKSPNEDHPMLRPYLK